MSGIYNGTTTFSRLPERDTGVSAIAGSISHHPLKKAQKSAAKPDVQKATVSGEVAVNAEAKLKGPASARLSRDGGAVVLEAASDAKVLLLAGEPIDEPVAAYGPFVMNSEAEIRQAINDFQSGRFGQL